MAKTMEGRVVAFSHIYEGGDVVGTRLFFADGEELLVKGHFCLTELVTVAIRYKKNDAGENEIKGIKVLAG